MRLTDDVIVQYVEAFLRGRRAFRGFDQAGLILFPNNIHAEFNAFITDEYGRTCDQLANFMLALATK